MQPTIHHLGEPQSNETRAVAATYEPRSLRTFTPSQAVLAKSSGVFHWTPEGRRLYDFTSGVLVSNLGHNPTAWMQRFMRYLGWHDQPWHTSNGQPGFFAALPMNAYNAVTSVETEASKRLSGLMRSRPGGARLQRVLWAASGSEAIQKALWGALASDKTRDVIIATRHGFHGKKGLAGAVTGSEQDKERDPRVRFISFPMEDCAWTSAGATKPLDLAPYERELEALKHQFGRRLACLITEPYIGGGGSYHPPKSYLQLLASFCRDNDLVFILDEIQANFGRTGQLFGFETYGIEPDMVVLGKSLGNGVPVAAVVGAHEVFARLDYGECSDTWSANPLCCAAVLATLDEFAGSDVIGHCRRVSAILEQGLLRLKELPFVAHVRGERGGMVWGDEMADHAGRSAAEWANAVILACYLGLGEGSDGIHILGALANKVLRIAPPLILMEQEARDAGALMLCCLKRLVEQPQPVQSAISV